jgi:hypothetical protein
LISGDLPGRSERHAVRVQRGRLRRHTDMERGRTDIRRLVQRWVFVVFLDVDASFARDIMHAAHGFVVSSYSGDLPRFLFWHAVRMRHGLFEHAVVEQRHAELHGGLYTCELPQRSGGGADVRVHGGLQRCSDMECR